jgi:predicted transcriptional regulator
MDRYPGYLLRCRIRPLAFTNTDMGTKVAIKVSTLTPAVVVRVADLVLHQRLPIL